MNDDLSDLIEKKSVVQPANVAKAASLGWSVLFVVGGFVLWFKYFKK